MSHVLECLLSDNQLQADRKEHDAATNLFPDFKHPDQAACTVTSISEASASLQHTSRNSAASHQNMTSNDKDGHL